MTAARRQLHPAAAAAVGGRARASGGGGGDRGRAGGGGVLLTAKERRTAGEEEVRNMLCLPLVSSCSPQPPLNQLCPYPTNQPLVVPTTHHRPTHPGWSYR